MVPAILPPYPPLGGGGGEGIFRANLIYYLLIYLSAFSLFAYIVFSYVYFTYKKNELNYKTKNPPRNKSRRG